MNRIIAPLLLIVCVCSFGIKAEASWEIVAPSAVVDFDYLPGYGGLIGYRAPGSVAIFRNGQITGTLPVNTKMGSVAIFDSNTAYAHVDGNLWVGKKQWTEWSIIEQNSEHYPIGRADGRMFFRTPLGAEYLTPGSPLQPTAGLLAMLSQIAEYDPTTIFARDTLHNLYRSTDKGGTFTKLSLTNVIGIYADGANGVLYASTTNSLFISYDKGATFQPLTAPPFAEYKLEGPIAGSHDCSGVLYVHSADFVRTIDHGVSFQKIGQAPVTPKNSLKYFVYGRGANLLLLSKFGTLHQSKDGSDGTLSDTLASSITYRTGTPKGNICGAPSVETLTLYSSLCSPIMIERSKKLSQSGPFLVSTPATFFTDSIKIPITFSPQKTGLDSALFRYYILSKDDLKRDSIDIMSYGDGTAAPAAYSGTERLDFGDVRVDTSTTLVANIKNEGCDSLQILSLISSDPSVFDVASFSAKLTHQADRNIQVHFAPKSKKPYLESIEVETNLGTYYITLTGNGSEVTKGVDAEGSETVRMWPNPANKSLMIRGPFPPQELTFINAWGKEFTRSLAQTSTQTDQIVSVADLPSGFYVVQIGQRRHSVIIRH